MFSKKIATKKVLLFGGIGNQLFQLSRAYQYTLDNEICEVIKFNFGKRLIYKILNLTNHDDWIDMKSLSSEISIPLKNASFLDILHLFVVLFQKKVLQNSSVDSIYFDNNDNVIDNKLHIDVGYYQSLKHVSIEAIEVVANALIDHLNLRNMPSSTEFAIHVRAPSSGTGREHPQFISNKDVMRIQDHAKKNNLMFKIVTNDIKSALSLFPFANENNFYVGNNAQEDFIFLSLSKNLFITNSTFSFWAYFCSNQLYLEKEIRTDEFWYSDFLDKRT
jgi:hypothetical protein